jgi:hypothetical protein
MARRFELQCWHHAWKKPIGMKVHQRLIHFAVAGAFAMRRSVLHAFGRYLFASSECAAQFPSLLVADKSAPV